MIKISKFAKIDISSEKVYIDVWNTAGAYKEVAINNNIRCYIFGIGRGTEFLEIMAKEPNSFFSMYYIHKQETGYFVELLLGYEFKVYAHASIYADWFKIV